MAAAMIDPALLDILRCPVTGGRLELQGEHLVDQRSGLRYPIRDGLPILLPDAAELPPSYESLEQVRQAFAATEQPT